MSEGDAEDDLDNPYFQYQPPTAPLQPERINTDPSSRPATHTDPVEASGTLDIVR